MELDKEINFLIKEETLWMKAKLSMKERMDIAELLQRYAEQLNKPCVSNNVVAVCPNCKSHDISKIKTSVNIMQCDTCDWVWAN